MTFSLVSKDQGNQILNWHKRKGGFYGHPAAHALKALEEMIELCIASGALPDDVQKVVDKELVKAEQKGEVSSSPNKYRIGEEIADTVICLVICQEVSRVSCSAEIDNKLPILYEREWQPNNDGVLRRPGRE
jgi:hypothetical protein